jgi:hypothetical protein
MTAISSSPSALIQRISLRRLTRSGIGEPTPESFHPEIIMTVEFPPGPAAIGIDLIERYATVRRADELLYVYKPTDVVRDRLLHYWAWGDFNALRVAIDVAKAQRQHVDFDAIRDWTNREIKEAPAAYDSVRRDLFVEDIRVALT